MDTLDFLWTIGVVSSLIIRFSVKPLKLEENHDQPVEHDAAQQKGERWASNFVSEDSVSIWVFVHELNECSVGYAHVPEGQRELREWIQEPSHYVLNIFGRLIYHLKNWHGDWSYDTDDDVNHFDDQGASIILVEEEWECVNESWVGKHVDKEKHPSVWHINIEHFYENDTGNSWDSLK